MHLEVDNLLNRLKTSELVREVERFEDEGERGVVASYSLDGSL